MIIADALNAYLADRRGKVCRIDAIEFAVRQLSEVSGHIDVEDREAIGAAVQAYVDARMTEVLPGTIRRDLTTLRGALTRAWKRGQLSHQPYILMPEPGRPRERWLTPAEAQSLIHHANPRIKLFIRLALATGARLTALLELTWDRVNLDTGVVDLRVVHPLERRRKGRGIVPIAKPLMMQLRAAKAKAGDEIRVVPFVASNLRRMFRSACRKAGLQGVTIHTLRHTAATWMIASEVPLPKVAKMLGHSSTAITEQVYGHLGTEHLRGAAAVLGKMIK